MECINRIELQGVVGQVSRHAVMDKDMVRIMMCTNRYYKTAEGEDCIDTEWHNITAYHKEEMPDFAEITKGTKLHVVGRLKLQRYVGVNGIERAVPEIVASELSIINE